MRHDWMPGKREDQLLMAQKWVFELPNANGKWQVTPEEISELEALAKTAEDLLITLAAGSAADKARVREAFGNMVRCMRFLHSRKFFSPPMDDSDYIRLGLKPPDRIRTGHMVVNELVEFVIGLRGPRELVVDFWIKGADHKAKPEGYDGAVLVWDTLDAPPKNPAGLARHTMASRTPHTLEFNETERGKKVYIALCWQNARGICGPWSDIESAVVP